MTTPAQIITQLRAKTPKKLWRFYWYTPTDPPTLDATATMRAWGIAGFVGWLIVHALAGLIVFGFSLAGTEIKPIEGWYDYDVMLRDGILWWNGISGGVSVGKWATSGKVAEAQATTQATSAKPGVKASTLVAVESAGMRRTDAQVPMALVEQHLGIQPSKDDDESTPE